MIWGFILSTKTKCVWFCFPQEEEEELDRIEEEYRQEDEEEFKVLHPPISLKNLKTLWVPFSFTCLCRPAKPIYTILPITKYKILAKLALKHIKMAIKLMRMTHAGSHRVCQNVYEK